MLTHSTGCLDAQRLSTHGADRLEVRLGTTGSPTPGQAGPGSA